MELKPAFRQRAVSAKSLQLGQAAPGKVKGNEEEEHGAALGSMADTGHWETPQGSWGDAAPGCHGLGQGVAGRWDGGEGGESRSW